MGVTRGIGVISFSTRPVQGAAGRGRLGVGMHIVERRQALGCDRRGDLALADAVAATDLRVIRRQHDSQELSNSS